MEMVSHSLEIDLEKIRQKAQNLFAVELRISVIFCNKILIWKVLEIFEGSAY